MINEIVMTGLREVTVKIQTTNRQIDVVTHKGMREAVSITRKNVIANTGKTGAGKPWPHLNRSIETRVNKGSGSVEGRIFANDSQPEGKVRTLELGGGGGRMPPPRNLLPWVQQHFANGDMAAAYALAQRLKSKKQPARKMFEKGLAASEPDIIRIFENSIYEAIN
jgi:hypothetical protein